MGGGLWALAGQGGLSDVWQSRVVPLAVIALGALIALSRSGGVADDVVIPIRRYGSLFVPAHAKLLPSEGGVRRIVVRAIFGSLRVDLSEAVFPQDDEARGVLYADVTVLFGRVEFVLGEGCAVVLAGEIHTFGTSLTERVPVFGGLGAYNRTSSTFNRRLEVSLVGAAWSGPAGHRVTRGQGVGGFAPGCFNGSLLSLGWSASGALSFKNSVIR